MPRLFHLSCSPRANSESAAGARVFLDGFRKARANWDIDVMNLWRDKLPELEGYLLEAKYARTSGRPFTDGQRAGEPDRCPSRIRSRSPCTGCMAL